MRKKNPPGTLGVEPSEPDYILIIPVIMPSLNEQLRMHWAARKRLNENAGWHLLSVLGHHPTIAHRDRLAHVLIRVCSNAPKSAGGRARRLDTDNLIGAQKGLVDSMKRLGIIKNDSGTWLDIGYTENRDHVEHPRTEIEITYNANRAGHPGRQINQGGRK